MVVDVPLHVVKGMAVLRDRGAAGHNLGIVPDENVEHFAVILLQHIAEAIEMVKILQKREVELIFHIRVLFPLCQDRSEIDRKLFVSDCRLQKILVDRL